MELHQPAKDLTRPPQASELVAACEEAWSSIQKHHPRVPDAVIILGSGVERGRLVKLGHWWSGRWIADDQVRGEVLRAGEALHLKPEDVLEVLLHEAAHSLNADLGINDTSRGGRYHNARFRQSAGELGLSMTTAPPYGWAGTALTDVARERYRSQTTNIGDAMRLARRLDTNRAGVVGGSTGAGNPGHDSEEQSLQGTLPRNIRAVAECQWPRTRTRWGRAMKPVNPSAAALGYAARCWAVLPCHHALAAGCSCRRADCGSP